MTSNDEWIQLRTSVRGGDARETVMQATQYRGHDDSSRLCGVAFTESSWDALSDSLMWPRAIVVIDVFFDHTAQVVSMEDERVVKALLFHTANKPLANSVRSRCSVGCLQFLNTGAPGDRCELLTVLFVAVANEVFRALAPGRGFPELLRYPGIRGGTRHSGVHNAACLQLDNDKDVESLE